MLAGLAVLPLATLAPRPRPPAPASPEIGAILASSGLGPVCGFAVADATTGELLEAHAPRIPRAPGSVAKVLTGVYALAALGPGHRFRTELRATPEGVVLAGGGDPVLDTDALTAMVAAARDRWPADPSRFLAAAGALPSLAEIEPGQPRHEAYNPAISGLNLNFNRVHLAWDPADEGAELRLTAPGGRGAAAVRSIRAELADGAVPPLEHGFETGSEVWRLAGRSARTPGSVWLPVRRPAAYAGEVFHDLARQAGLALPPPQVVGGAPDGVAMAVHDSPELTEIVRSMLRYSTNLTAEVLGLSAATARGNAPGDLAASARDMSDWARGRYRLDSADLANHSGLTDRSRVSPADMVQVLVAEAPEGRLAPLLRAYAMPAGDGAPEARVVAKTGTLFFIRGLAGYLEASGRRLAFAILAADAGARQTMPGRDAPPPGARDWLRRARNQETALLRRWSKVYAA